MVGYVINNLFGRLRVEKILIVDEPTGRVIILEHMVNEFQNATIIDHMQKVSNPYVIEGLSIVLSLILQQPHNPHVMKFTS